MKKTILFLLLLIFTLSSLAQNTVRSPLEGTRYGVVYEVSAMKDVKQKANVPYLTDAKGTEVIDMLKSDSIVLTKLLKLTKTQSKKE